MVISYTPFLVQSILFGEITMLVCGGRLLADYPALIVDAGFGPVIITGCAHRGIINTIRQAQILTGGKSVYTIIGGTHPFRTTRVTG
ncbi:MAG: hypothetical protein PHF74_08065 [Dehalococcoidales bacterium]|nr:hypothetical protein [Dehalococcoidales bacterium]